MKKGLPAKIVASIALFWILVSIIWVWYTVLFPTPEQEIPTILWEDGKLYTQDQIDAINKLKEMWIDFDSSDESKEDNEAVDMISEQENNTESTQP